MNFVMNAEIVSRGGTIPIWSIPRIVQDEEPINDVWLMRGDSWPWQFTITLDGAALDLTSKSLELDIVVPTPIDPTLIVALSPVGDLTSGVVSGIVSPAVTALAPPGTYRATVMLNQNGLTDSIATFQCIILDDLIK